MRKVPEGLSAGSLRAGSKQSKRLPLSWLSLQREASWTKGFRSSSGPRARRCLPQKRAESTS